MNSQETKKRLLAAYDLLKEDSTTIQKLESIRTLIKGINGGIDKILERVFEAHGKLSKIQEGEIIELSAESLPERNEQEKKRKKALLLFIKNWKQLQNEVERISSEFEKESKTDTQKVSNILASAKGPFGIITIAAVVIVATLLVLNSQKPENQTPKASTSSIKATQQKIKVIDFNGKKIPLNELTTGVGGECLTNREPAEHYHAEDHNSAKATDGSVVSDPGGCGFGKVDEVKVQEVVL